MYVSQSFIDTRKKVSKKHEDTPRLILDIMAVCKANRNAWYKGEKRYRTHFHAVNGKNIAATVILTSDNHLFMRGVEYTTFSGMFQALEKLEN